MTSPSRLPSVRRKPGDKSSRPVSSIHDGKPTLRPPTNYETESDTRLKRRSLVSQTSRTNASGRKVLESGDSGEERDETVKVAARENALAALEESSKMPLLSTAGQSSRLARPTSVRPPSISTSGARPRSVRMKQDEAIPELKGHITRSSISARPESTSTTRASASSNGLQRSTSTRTTPASKPVGRTASVQAKQPAHSRTASTTSTATTSVAGKRETLQRTRPPSIDTTQASRPSSGGSLNSPKSGTNLRQNARTQMPPPSRPGFTTYQQHYSPAKSALPKPPLPTSKPSKPQLPNLEPALTFETTKQHIELLQLSLLHQNSGRVQREYEGSAKRKLGKRHAQLCKEYESIRAAEAEQTKLRNLEALAAWSGSDSATLVESLQVLGRVYAEVSPMAMEGSRYAELVREFEVWVEGAEAKFEDGDGGEGFVEALPDEWRSAQGSFALKLRSLQRNFGTLPPLPQGAEDSRLGVMLGSCGSLIKGMIGEVDVMTALEEGILEREKRRITDTVRGFQNGILIKNRGWVPAWQKTGNAQATG